MSKVSIILAVYNGEKYITESIESVLNQNFSEFELIVVNDGSVDDTEKKIKPYLHKIRYIKKVSNEGLAAARNTGILVSRGNLIAFQDADDIWLPQKLKKQVSFMRKNKDVAMVYADSMEFDENGTRKDSFFKYHTPVSGWIFEHLIDENPIICSTVIVRKEVFEKCNLFDVSLSSIEDYDMWLRIAYHYNISYINEVLIKKRYHDYNMTKNKKVMAINGVRVFEKAIVFFKNSSRKINRKIRRQLRIHYWDLAWHYFSNVEMSISRRNLLLVLRYQMNLKPLCYYFFSFFPKRVLKILKQARNNLYIMICR